MQLRVSHERANLQALCYNFDFLKGWQMFCLVSSGDKCLASSMPLVKQPPLYGEYWTLHHEIESLGPSCRSRSVSHPLSQLKAKTCRTASVCFPAGIACPQCHNPTSVVSCHTTSSLDLVVSAKHGYVMQRDTSQLYESHFSDVPYCTSLANNARWTYDSRICVLIPEPVKSRILLHYITLYSLPHSAIACDSGLPTLCLI